jgi:hypothetical protein
MQLMGLVRLQCQGSILMALAAQVEHAGVGVFKASPVQRGARVRFPRGDNVDM